MSIAFPTRATESTLRRGAVTAACMMAMFMAAVEVTIVATAMPTIVSELGGFHLFSWVFAAYLLSAAVSTPVYGRLSDLYGRRRMFMIGATVFLLGSTACGFTWALHDWGMVALVVFRMFQGLGAGSLQSMSTTIIGDIYPPAERARVQGWLSGIWGIAAIAGPVFGAFIVQHLHWAFVFWINLPIGIGAMIVLARNLDEHIEPRRHDVDLAGAGLLMLGVGSLLMLAVQARILSTPVATALLITGIAALGLLTVVERRAREPIVPFRLWRRRVMAVGNFGGLAVGMLLMCVVAFLPTYVEAAMGRTVVFAGLALTTQSVCWSLGAVLAGRMLAVLSYRTLGVIGGLMLLGGTAFLIALTPDSTFLWLAAAAACVGLGMGFCNQMFLLVIQGSVGWSERGVATSSLLFLRTIGQSLGAATGGALLNYGIAHHAPTAGNAVERLLDPARRMSLGADTIAQLGTAIAGALHEVYLIAGILAAVALAMSLLLPERLAPPRAPGG